MSMIVLLEYKNLVKILLDFFPDLNSYVKLFICVANGGTIIPDNNKVSLYHILKYFQGCGLAHVRKTFVLQLPFHGSATRKHEKVISATL